MARCWGLSLSVVFLLGSSVVASAQQDFSKVEVTSEKLAEGVYMLQGAGGNIGLSVGADAAFLIDDQYAPLTPKIKAAVAALTEKAPEEFPRLLVMWSKRVEVATARHQGASIEIGHRLSNGAHREFRWNPDAVV
jgi:hypothetical protein